jgi:hypothetical protein
LEFLRSPLVGGEVTRRDRQLRLLLFIAWLALVGWLFSAHVFWRDEVRAFSFALSGSNVVEMLHNVHGEGHPALWYLILRGAHDLFPYREVLPVAAALIAIAAMAMIAFFSPFRSVIVGLVLFSFYGAFEYVVVARNYAIAALVMFVLAAFYGRVRNTLWFGLILAVLCNTNVPSCLLAAIFLLFRVIEMMTDEAKHVRRDWLIFIGNAAIAAVGAYLCFRTVYPTFNDAALASNASDFTPARLLFGLLFSERGFAHLGPGMLALSWLGLVRRPAAMCAAIAGFVALKLFFFLVFVSFYRHEALYLAFLLSLYWMSANGAGGTWRQKPWMDYARLLGTYSFIALLAVQSVLLIVPIRQEIAGIPYSRSADAARLLRQPSLAGAIVMADPDTMLEPLPYYADNPLWFMRQRTFGRVVRLSRNARKTLSLDDVLADAERLHRQTGRPIVFLSHLDLRAEQRGRHMMMYEDVTDVTPDAARRLQSSMRLVARLRPAGTDEDYDVYVYPR